MLQTGLQQRRHRLLAACLRAVADDLQAQTWDNDVARGSRTNDMRMESRFRRPAVGGPHKAESAMGEYLYRSLLTKIMRNSLTYGVYAVKVNA